MYSVHPILIVLDLKNLEEHEVGILIKWIQSDKALLEPSNNKYQKTATTWTGNSVVYAKQLWIVIFPGLPSYAFLLLRTATFTSIKHGVWKMLSAYKAILSEQNVINRTLIVIENKQCNIWGRMDCCDWIYITQKKTKSKDSFSYFLAFTGLVICFLNEAHGQIFKVASTFTWEPSGQKCEISWCKLP